MNFQRTARKTAIVGAIVAVGFAGSTLSSGSAQAATLTDGSLNITTDTQVTNLVGGNLQMAITTTGVPVKAGGFVGTIGIPTFQTLALTKSGSSWTTGPVTNFMRNLFLGGDEIFFDITAPITFNGNFTNSSNYSLSASIISGVFRNSSNTILGAGAITGVRIRSNDSSSVNLVGTAIPTPALLPGIAAMGATMLRRRKRVAALV